MKTKTLIMTVALIAVILAPVALAAPDGPRGPRGGGGGPGQGRGGFGGGGGNIAQMILGRMGEELNLTDEQKASITKIAEDSRTTNQENRQAVQEAMEALNKAADKGTEAEIIAAGKAAGDALTKQALQRAETSKKVKAVLTDEQNAKLEELKTQMQQRMEQMRQQRREQRQNGKGEGPRRRRNGRGEE